MKKTAALLLIAALMLSCNVAFAASPWTEKDSYGEKVAGKLDFGVKNVLAGWTELFNRPIKFHKDGKTVTEGVVHGVVNAITNTVGGALHLVTFPITAVDVPLPNNGVSFE